MQRWTRHTRSPSSWTLEANALQRGDSETWWSQLRVLPDVPLKCQMSREIPEGWTLWPRGRIQKKGRAEWGELKWDSTWASKDGLLEKGVPSIQADVRKGTKAGAYSVQSFTQHHSAEPMLPPCGAPGSWVDVSMTQTHGGMAIQPGGWGRSVMTYCTLERETFIPLEIRGKQGESSGGGTCLGPSCSIYRIKWFYRCMCTYWK